ncbi:hypothetical protein NEOLEDRAFT_1142849 [Neolentinus lepideus HHB14362 ss-1]|uniref:Secreted protein n=1 Tax=Neolentinus lepideus HHB14362 ss-1 TaxID=1314782 RepID=A0A165MW70_9AGAM|nr:hypothetical protein NEOLEDRAFT_1142849 [Neolentinus lepideus HHB14362 ss-1]
MTRIQHYSLPFMSIAVMTSAIFPVASPAGVSETACDPHLSEISKETAPFPSRYASLVPASAHSRCQRPIHRIHDRLFRFHLFESCHSRPANSSLLVGQCADWHPNSSM